MAVTVNENNLSEVLAETKYLLVDLGSLRDKYLDYVTQIRKESDEIDFSLWEDDISAKVQEFIKADIMGEMKTIEDDIQSRGFQSLFTITETIQEQLEACVDAKKELDSEKELLEQYKDKYNESFQEYNRMEKKSSSYREYIQRLGSDIIQLQTDIKNLQTELNEMIDNCNKLFEKLAEVEFNSDPVLASELNLITQYAETRVSKIPEYSMDGMQDPYVEQPGESIVGMPDPYLEELGDSKAPKKEDLIQQKVGSEDPILIKEPEIPPGSSENQPAKEGNWFQRSLATVGDVVLSVVEGGFTGVENVVDGALSCVGWVGGWFSDDFQENVNNIVEVQFVHGISDTIAEKTGINKYSVLPDTAADIIVNAGSLAVPIALSSVGVPAWATIGVQGVGRGTEWALINGSTGNEAFGQGVKTGVVQGATTALLTNVVGPRVGDFIFGKISDSLITNPITLDTATSAATSAVDAAAKTAVDAAAKTAVDVAATSAVDAAAKTAVDAAAKTVVDTATTAIIPLGP